MEDKDIAKVYDLLRQKHNLSEYEQIDKIFEISSIESPEFLLRKIRRKIIEKLRAYIDVLEDLIHPNATVSALHECNYFNEQEKKKISDIYSRLMSYVRLSDILDIQLDEAKDAEFIKKILSDWESTKHDLISIFKTLQSSWTEKEVADKSILAYFG